MGEIIFISIILGIPAIFLILCIKNIIKIVKLKKDKAAVEKSLITKATIFGVIFISIVIFYIGVMFLFSLAVANM